MCPFYLLEVMSFGRVTKKDWNSHIRAKNPIAVTPANLGPEVLSPGAGVQRLLL
jgi:hypothetical protein